MYIRDEANRTITEKGWFLHKGLFKNKWIPIGIEYKDCTTVYYSGSFYSWEDGVTHYKKRFRIWFPTKLLPLKNTYHIYYIESKFYKRRHKK